MSGEAISCPKKKGHILSKVIYDLFRPAHDIHTLRLAQVIQLIDKNDTGRLSRSLRKKASSHADKYFHKLRPADAEKWHLCSLRESARKIDDAHPPETGMRAARDSGAGKNRIEQVLPVTTPRYPIVNYHLDDHDPGIVEAIGDVFADPSLPFPMAFDPFPHSIALHTTVAGSTGSTLLCNKLCRSGGKSGRPGKRRQRFPAGQELDCLINSGNPLSGLYEVGRSRRQVEFPLKTAAHLAKKSGKFERIGAGQIDLLQDLTDRIFFLSGSRGNKHGEQENGHQDTCDSVVHFRVFPWVAKFHNRQRRPGQATIVRSFFPF